MSDHTPPVVVLTVDLLAGAFSDADCAQVLRLWRDGQIRPALNRSLLVRYLAVLRGLGLPDRVLRWWAFWLTSPAKVALVDDASKESIPLADLYPQVIAAARAKQIIHGATVRGGPGDKRPPGPVTWISAAEFVKRWEANAALSHIVSKLSP